MITITLHWWMLPLAYTVVSFLGFLIWLDAEKVQPGFMSFPVRPFIATPLWIIGCLVAWMIWALLA